MGSSRHCRARRAQRAADAGSLLRLRGVLPTVAREQPSARCRFTYLRRRASILFHRGMQFAVLPAIAAAAAAVYNRRMIFAPGQRWISTAEPELGLGTVLRVEGRTVQLAFPATGVVRHYA